MDYSTSIISNCTFYHLKELTHSHPYVVPEMADLLNEIGYIFKSKLKEKNQDSEACQNLLTPPHLQEE